MTVEDHAKHIIYQQAIQLSVLNAALTEAHKELAVLRPKPEPEPVNKVDGPAENKTAEPPAA